MPLFDLFWVMFRFFLGVAWIVILIKIFADLFRSDMSGVAKALWALVLVFFPLVGILVYLIAEGGGPVYEAHSADLRRIRF